MNAFVFGQLWISVYVGYVLYYVVGVCIGIIMYISDMYCILWTDICNSIDDICIYACAGTNPCASTLVQPQGLHSASGLTSVIRLRPSGFLGLRLIGEPSAQHFTANLVRA